MKILKIKTTSGYKMLEKEFEINFLTKTRVEHGTACDKDLILLQDDFYYPLQTILIGKNSSGKSTTLDLIYLVLIFINTGRIPVAFFPEQNLFDVEFLFYENGQVYKYNGSFEKNDLVSKDFLIIKDEKLFVSNLRVSTKKDLSNLSFRVGNQIVPNVGGDTSEISRFKSSDASILVENIARNGTNLNSIVKTINNLYTDDVFNSIIRLFDDSIEYLDFLYNDLGNPVAYKFKRVNKNEIIIDFNYLQKIISSGTYRGIYLFAASIIAFNFGGHILIDEIEKSFNKNFIENLILLFSDKRINKKGATLIYSTHYSELLDETNRCDNINVLHRADDVISIKNLSESYELRTDLLKSNQFNQNAFDNILNYDYFMNLRKGLLK